MEKRERMLLRFERVKVLWSLEFGVAPSSLGVVAFVPYL